jgi:hypothetical protein
MAMSYDPRISEVPAYMPITELPEAWKDRLRRHMESTPTTQAIDIDDSRESIYEDRESARS